MEEKTNNPKVFISYSWDNQTHENWVLQFAADLRKNGVDVILDKWENGLGADIPHFMDKSVRESDRVLCILTPKYKEKANNLKGGVGYEYRDMTAEIFANIPTNKFIPVLKEGSFEDSIPSALSGRVTIDMRLKRNYEKGLEEILRELFNKPKFEKPPLGPTPNFD